MGTLWQDLRYGWRRLKQSPGFTSVVVLTLALGVGANTAIFSVINAVLLRPLPFDEPGRLVALGQTSPRNRQALLSVSFRNFADWREQGEVFEAMAAWYGGNFTLAGGDEAARLRGAVVTADLFRVLRARPSLGRTFNPEDDQPGGGSAGRPVILSARLWRQRFGADPRVLGRALRLNGNDYIVVGVMPAEFSFPVLAEPVDLWTSVALDAETKGEGTIMVSRGYRVWEVIARLKPAVTLEQAQAVMDLIGRNLAAQYPEANTDVGVRVEPLLESLVGDTRPLLLTLLGAVGFVLLIACANVANLLLARAAARQREIAIRMALGGGRWRIARQLLTESILLAGLGGAVGILLAMWSTEALVALSPEELFRLTEMRFNARVLGFTLLVSLVTGVAAGLAPAVGAIRAGLARQLAAGARGSTAGRSRMRGALLVAEVALSLILLVSAGLLIQSLRLLQRVNLGFNPANLLTFSVDLSGDRYRELQPIIDFYRRLQEELGRLPGVEAVGLTSGLPLSGSDPSTSFDIEGRPSERGRTPAGSIRMVGLGYLRAMGIELAQGRDFTARDDLRAPRVVLVNEALAQRHFPSENPIGKRIKPGYSIEAEGDFKEIVGVVRNVKHRGPRAEPRPEIYFPHAQMPDSSMTVVLRAAAAPAALVAAAQRVVRALDKEAPVYAVRTFDHYLGRSVATARFSALLVAIFAGVALALTAIGLYGVISYSVAQRTPEIGIRMALGAEPRDVLKLIIGQGGALTLIGVALGLGGAFALTRLLASQLYGMSPTDPLTFAGVATLLVAVALIACYLPARRATRVDPLIALRHE